MTKDIVMIVGLSLLAAGLNQRFGWDIACIVIGALLVASALIGALKK